VIGPVHQVQSGEGLQAAGDIRNQIDPGKPVAGSLEKKHGDIYGLKVIRPVSAGLPRRVQRKAEKHQPPGAIE